MKQDRAVILARAILGIILGSVLAALVASTLNAQTCDSPPQLLRKGDTLVSKCDSLILIHAGRLRLALNFERNKNAALVRINTDKDKAVKALVNAYENRISNLQKQVETIEGAYQAAIDQHRETLYESRISTAKIEGSLEGLSLQLKTATDGAEMERYAAKRLLLKRSLIWGSVGVGIGAIFTTILFLGI